jgi:peptidoglycan DL-endopeptidase RipB
LSSPTLAAASFGSGQTASASNSQSGGLNALFAALGEQDLAAHANLQGALTSQAAGHGQMNNVISATLGDVTGLAPGTNTNGGLLALVSALAGRLEQAWQVLTTGNTDASTHAAGSAQVAAGYNSLTGAPSGGVAPAGALSSMGGLSTGTPSTAAPMSGMVPMQVWLPASAAASTAAATAAQAASAQQAASKSTPTQATLTSANKTVPTKVQDVINRGKHYIGTPYSYGGGTPSGPTYGIDSGRNTKGFDCSSFVQMAYWPYVHLPRTADAQALQGATVAFNDIQPGDLIFSERGESGPGAGHVEMAVGYGKHTQVISAAHTGTNISIWPGMDPTAYVVKRLLH